MRIATRPLVEVLDGIASAASLGTLCGSRESRMRCQTIGGRLTNDILIFGCYTVVRLVPGKRMIVEETLAGFLKLGGAGHRQRRGAFAVRPRNSCRR